MRSKKFRLVIMGSSDGISGENVKFIIFRVKKKIEQQPNKKKQTQKNSMHTKIYTLSHTHILEHIKDLQFDTHTKQDCLSTIFIQDFRSKGHSTKHTACFVTTL